MVYEDINKCYDAITAAALWRSAKHWLNVWAGAGFVGRVEDGKVYMTKGWADKFKDGPQLISALRNEIIELIEKGNDALKNDPRLMVKVSRQYYFDYLVDKTECEVKHQRYLKRQAEFWAKGNEKFPADIEVSDLAKMRADEKDAIIMELKKELHQERMKANAAPTR